MDLQFITWKYFTLFGWSWCRPWRQELIESWLFHCYLPSNYGVVLYFDIPDTPKPEDKTHLCQVILNLAQWLCGRGFRTGVFYSPYRNECKVTLHCFQELHVQGIKHRGQLHVLFKLINRALCCFTPYNSRYFYQTVFLIQKTCFSEIKNDLLITKKVGACKTIHTGFRMLFV